MYKLDDKGNPVRCDDVIEWAQWYETAERTVARTEVAGNVVSTVFLGLDHGFGDLPPVLWETMVFPECEKMERYASRESAIDGHERIVARLRAQQ